MFRLVKLSKESPIKLCDIKDGLLYKITHSHDQSYIDHIVTRYNYMIVCLSNPNLYWDILDNNDEINTISCLQLRDGYEITLRQCI